MPISYPIFYKRDPAGKVTSFYFPDLDYTFDLSHEVREPSNLDSYASQILLEHLTFLKNQQADIPYPEKLVTYKNLTANSQDFLTKVNVDFEFKKGFFERFLPKFGLFSAIVTSLTMAFIYFSAILITSDMTASNLTLTSMGVLSAAVMAVIVYNYSDAGKISMRLGKLLDKAPTHVSHCRTTMSHTINQLTQHPRSTARILTKLAATAIPITASTFSSIGHFQEVKSMGERISDDQALFKTGYFLVNDVMIIFSMYSLLTFQISFLPQVFKFIDQVFEPSKTNTNAVLPLVDNGQELHSLSSENVNLLIEDNLPVEEQPLPTLRHH